MVVLLVELSTETWNKFCSLRLNKRPGWIFGYPETRVFESFSKISLTSVPDFIFRLNQFYLIGVIGRILSELR